MLAASCKVLEDDMGRWGAGSEAARTVGLGGAEDDLRRVEVDLAMGRSVIQTPLSIVHMDNH